MNFLEPGQHARGIPVVGQGVPHLHVGRALDIGRHVARLAGLEFFAGVGLGIEAADFLHFIAFAGVQEADGHAGLDLAVEDAHVCDHALVGVEIGIKRQRLQTALASRLGRRHMRHDGFQNILNADAFLGAARNGRLAGHSQDVFQLLLRLGDVRVREVDLVDDRDDEQVLLGGEVVVGHGLRFHALGGIDHQQRTFAGAQAAGNFVGKIHVAGGVNKVQLVGLAVLGLVQHRDRVGLDGNAPFAFQVHGVQQLIGHVARGDGARAVQQPVGKRGLPVINVGNDAEVSYVCGVHYKSLRFNFNQCKLSRCKSEDDKHKNGHEK